MAEKRLTIFFFPAWYPHRRDSMFGLFVKRHAEAVSIFCNVGVVFAIGEGNLSNKTYDTVFSIEENVQTIRTYFCKSQLPVLGALINGFRYLRAIHKGYKFLSTKMGEPHVNHVHVLTRAGIFPLWINFSSQTPFVITEHWSRYLPINKGAYSGIIRKWLTKKIVKNASAVTPVSQRLSESMQDYGLENANYLLVNNVVDIRRFKPVINNKKECLRWIHVSCFDEHPKNITGLLTGFAQAYKQNPFLHLTLVGNGIDWESSKTFAANLNIDADAISFTGILEGEELANEFQKNDAFVMFSRFENQPVVIIEAFASGLPVVATAVGSIPEMLANHRGVIIPSENTDDLTAAFIALSNGKFEFSRDDIRQYATENYSFEAVGKRFYELYLAAIENNRP